MQTGNEILPNCVVRIVGHLMNNSMSSILYTYSCLPKKDEIFDVMCLVHHLKDLGGSTCLYSYDY